MWIEFQQQTTIVNAVNANCSETNEHSKGKAVTANLLNTSIPTEHVTQQLTAVTVSVVSVEDMAAW